MRFSEFWYEKLPVLYLLAALLVLLVLGRHGAFRAVVLLAAAALTRWWRVGRYRLLIAADGTRRRQATRKTLADAARRSA